MKQILTYRHFLIALTICYLHSNSPVYSSELSTSGDSSLVFFNMGIESRYGFILPHNSTMKYLVQKPTYGFDMVFFKRTSGDKPWHQMYRKPYTGFGLHYMNYGNPTYLGEAYAAYAFIDFHTGRNKNSGFVYHWGEGVAYLTKPFDAENNNFNIAIGSALNVFIDLSAAYVFRLNNGMIIKPSLSFTHYSNGSYKKPNLGINVINSKLLISFPTWETKNYDTNPVFSKPKNRKMEYQLFIVTGMHQKDPPLSPVYAVYDFRGQANYIFGKKHSAGLGADVFNDHALNTYTGRSKSSITRTGIFVAYNTLFDNVYFTAQAGYYISDHYKNDGKIYSRFGFSGIIYKGFTAGLFLKTHFFVADNIEFGLGYTFQQ